MKKMKLLPIITWMAGLALLLNACTTPAAAIQGSQPTSTAHSLSAYTETAATPAPILPVDPQPSPTVELGLPNGSEFSYQGIRFVLDPAVASAASGEVIPEHPASPDGPYWDVNPQYVKISLKDYAVNDSLIKPEISIYPAEEFLNMSAPAAENINNLKTFLAQKPADAERIPFLQIWNASQVFHSNMKYLEFKGGRGVRYLAIYAQYPAPVNSYDLFYTFQGLTADGRYAVSITLPVSNPSLPSHPNQVSQAQMEENIKNPEYYSSMSSMLSAQQDSSFTPDLAKLDALIASLEVK